MEIEKNEPSDKDFEVQWDGPQDPEDPKNLSTWRKWIMVLIVSQASFLV